MTVAIINFSEINNNPIRVMSAEYWVNIKNGKFPFSKINNEYVCSHTKNLNKAIYMSESEAIELNIAIQELDKSKELVENLKKKFKL
jgi:hypothetical protein